MKKIIIGILFNFLFVGCGIIKTAKILNQVTVQDESFNIEVPFEYRLELMIVKVNIGGKEYDFFVDTGAPTLISKELALAINKKSQITQKVGSSNTKKEKLDFINLDQIGIGGVNFYNVGAAVSDINSSNVLSCMKVDGIIGANLMKTAFWKFDFKTQKIKIASSIDSFGSPSRDATVVPIIPNKVTGTPIVELDFVDKKIRAIIDTGSNGGFGFGKHFLKRLKKNNISSKILSGYGTESYGIFGGEVDTTYYAALSNVKLENMEFKDVRTSFVETSGGRIGLDFIKNYNVTFDWADKKMILEPKRKFKNDDLINYGFKWMFRDNKLLVRFIYNNSKAKKLGMQLGDQILSINNNNFEDLSQDEQCNYILNNPMNSYEECKIKVVRDGKELTFNLSIENNSIL